MVIAILELHLGFSAMLKIWQSMCGVPPSHNTFLCGVPPPTLILGPGWIINLAQLVSSSVALLAELVSLLVESNFLSHQDKILDLLE